ncbi:las1-like family protein isoform X2 [Wolffia australiana]
MELGIVDSDAEIGPGYMLVPWSSWDQWNFVRNSLFSASIESVRAALGRVAAWKSRGCLPVAVEVTARIIEIQHMDPFFFGKEDAGVVLNSEDMLALLYSITLTRFVNGFTEKVSYFDDHAQKHGRKKHSISNLANAIGLPRMVVDIRHESSHNEVPSLPLVRLASVKALDWLKSHYWEPQRRAIPDIRRQVRRRIRQMSCIMKDKSSEKRNVHQIKEKGERLSAALRMNSKLSSSISGKLLSSKNKGASTQMSKISKIVSDLYSLYPREVTSELLELIQSQSLALSARTAVESNSSTEDLDPRIVGLNESKEIVRKLSRKRPGLLLTMLEEIFAAIEAEENKRSDKVMDKANSRINLLSPLVLWLSSTLKDFKNSGHVSLSDDSWMISSNSKKSTPKVSVKEILRRCLVLSSSGNQHLLDSCAFLASTLADDRIIKGIQELSSTITSQKPKSKPENGIACSEIQIYLEERSIRQASAKIEGLKSKRKAEDAGSTKKARWTVDKEWIPCPIGTLTCPLSSTYSVPILDKAVVVSDDHGDSDRQLSEEVEFDKPDRVEEVEDGRRNLVGSPMEGLLLIDGVWRAVGREELLLIQSAVRILA